MNNKKKTIRKTSEAFSGVGLHTGILSTIRFVPAGEDIGIVFKRIDIEGCPEILADIENVTDISRGTTISLGGVCVATTEHILAAIRGLDIDNIIIEINGPEVPVADGSAKPFVDILNKAGIVEQESQREYFEVIEPISFSSPEDGVDIVVTPADRLKITFMVDYDHPYVPTQYTWFPSIEYFEEQFAPARTFCFLDEILFLKEKGLIKGGSLENAIVVADPKKDKEHIKKLEKLLNHTSGIVIDDKGLLNGTTLRFPNEFVRHKTLDLIGDLALLGVPIKGHFLAARSGHKTNIELVKKLRNIYQKQLLEKKYQDRRVKNVVFDINAIKRILPHRYPFLLIDKIIEFIPGKRIVGIKNITINEPFFQGHFPDHPIMPGVLIVEALAQTGGMMLLNAQEDPTKKNVYFASMDKVKFRKPVTPGDILRLELTVISLKRSLCKMRGVAFVGQNRVAEAELLARIMDK